MLRTAQEIIDETFERAKKDALVSEIYIMAVNTAVREAIEECAAAAELLAYYKGDNGEKVEPQNVGKEVFDMETPDFYSVDPQSILKLIDQIK